MTALSRVDDQLGNVMMHYILGNITPINIREGNITPHLDERWYEIKYDNFELMDW